MRRARIFALLPVLICACKEVPVPCPLNPVDTSGACWERAAPLGSGAFPAQWQPGKFPLGVRPIRAFRDELWMIGQTASWSSIDGLNWRRHGKEDWGERIGEAYAFFNGQLWMFGGLGYSSRAVLNDVWRSADGAHWERAGDAAWPGREGQTVVAFKDKLWLFGGTVHVAYEDRSPDQFVNDVWSSEDGVQWAQVTAAAPWPAMDYPQVLVFQDALYLLGGEGHAEVWRSEDGAQWTQLAQEAAWGARYGQGAALFDGRLWVYGGEPAPREVRHPGVPIHALNDIRYSADGVTWLLQAEHGPWSPRTGMTSAVFNDKLWIFSGKHTGASDNWGGDIWTLKAVPQR
jgi:N-acetylneuraminic acid mutarotase